LANQEHTSLSTHPTLHDLLEAVRRGDVGVADAERQAREFLSADPFEDLGFARVDHHRATRQGFPEVIYGQGKTPDQVAAIARAITDRGHSLLITRTTVAA